MKGVNQIMSKEKAKEKIKIKHNSKTNGINGSPWSTFFLTAPYITLFFVFEGRAAKCIFRINPLSCLQQQDGDCSSLSALRGPCQPGIFSKMAAQAGSAVTGCRALHANSSVGLTGMMQSSQHFLTLLLHWMFERTSRVRSNTKCF